MPKEVDARGLACPQPVINTKKALEETDEVLVIVDNDTARENVLRLAKNSGCTAETENRPEGIFIRIRRTAAAPSPKQETGTPSEGPLVVVISEDIMGRGNAELGAILMRSFLHTLTDIDRRPDTIILFNCGVRLAVRDSAVVADLRELEARGVDILVCGTCLNFFQLTGNLEAGKVSNMYDITETLFSAGRIVTL